MQHNVLAFKIWGTVLKGVNILKRDINKRKIREVEFNRY